MSTNAFVTVNAAQGSAIAEANDIDIRTWCVRDRKALMTGSEVAICVGDTVVADIPQALLKVTSLSFDKLCTGGKIVLPAATDKAGVVSLISYLRHVANSEKAPLPMPKPSTVFGLLSVCAAAKALNMEKYVDHIYKTCEAILRKDPPTYEAIEAITAMKDQHTRLFNIVVNSLAARIWDDSIPDPEEFKAYLAHNRALDNAIFLANEEYAERLGVEAERKQQWLQREAEREKSQARRKEDEGKRTAKWAAKEVARAACERSVKAKSQRPVEKRQKFTPEEKLHWMRTRGSQPPKGC